MKYFIFSLLTLLIGCYSNSKIEKDSCYFQDKVNGTYNFLEENIPVMEYGYELLCAYDIVDDSNLKFIPDLKCTTINKEKKMSDTLYQLDLKKLNSFTLTIKQNISSKKETKILIVPLYDYETRKARNGSFSGFKLKSYDSYWVNVATILLNSCH